MTENVVVSVALLEVNVPSPVLDLVARTVTNEILFLCDSLWFLLPLEIHLIVYFHAVVHVLWIVNRMATVNVQLEVTLCKMSERSTVVSPVAFRSWSNS